MRNPRVLCNIQAQARGRVAPDHATIILTGLFLFVIFSPTHGSELAHSYLFDCIVSHQF